MTYTDAVRQGMYRPLERVLGFANVAGAIVASRLECSTAMPTDHEVEQLFTEVRNDD